MKKILSGLTAALLLTHLSVFAISASAEGAEYGQVSSVTTEYEKITDIEIICDMMTEFINENNLDARIVSDKDYPQYMGSVVIEFNAETGANITIIKYAETYNIERTAFNLVPCFNGSVITTVNPDSTATTTTTTTTAVVEQITDIDQIREMLTKFIAENELDAKVVSNEEYSGYQPIVIEYNSEKSANMAILEYTQENNIDTSNVGFVPIVEGVAVTTVNPDSTITTTTTTTTTTVSDDDDPNTTTTAVFDYSTFLEYDSSPMKVGETRTVRFYNPELKAMTNMNAYEVSENISYSYEEGSDTLTITALAPGKARMYIMGEGCAFGCYLNIEVVDDSSATTPMNNDGTEELPQTGYSNIYKVIAGLAALMTVSGAALVVKTRKENE